MPNIFCGHCRKFITESSEKSICGVCGKRDRYCVLLSFAIRIPNMKPKSFRLSDKSCKALVRLAEEQRRSQSAVIEILILTESKKKPGTK